MKRKLTTGERIRMERERREAIGWLIACIVAAAVCCGILHMQAAMKDVRVTMEVRK
jgi:hypothetical protein